MDAPHPSVRHRLRRIRCRRGADGGRARSFRTASLFKFGLVSIFIVIKLRVSSIALIPTQRCKMVKLAEVSNSQRRVKSGFGFQSNQIESI